MKQKNSTERGGSMKRTAFVKIISVILTLVMLISSVPLTGFMAYAAETEKKPATREEEKLTL